MATLLSLALPAQAHSEAELDVWVEHWHEAGENPPPLDRVALASTDLDRLEAAWSDMADRHPCSRALRTWSQACERPAPAPRSPASPSPSGVHRGMGSNVEQWRGLVAAYFGSEVERALCVVAWESGGNPGAASPTNDHGLFQIHAPLWTDHYGVSITQLYDPETNTRLAKSIRDTQGWIAWSAVKREKC